MLPMACWWAAPKGENRVEEQERKRKKERRKEGRKEAIKQANSLPSKSDDA